MGRGKRYLGLKSRIMVFTLLPVVISTALISTVIFASLFGSLHETAGAEFLQLGQKYADRVENKLNVSLNYLMVVGSVLEMRVQTGATDRELQQKTILKVFDDYELVDGSGIYFEPDVYDGRDAEYIGTEYGSSLSGRISWYYYWEDGETAYLPEITSGGEEFLPACYTEAKRANRTVYTEPVIYERDGKKIPMFSIARPLHDSGGEFIGAVTADLFLKDIYERLQKESIYETGYMVIANGEGYIIYSPRYEDIGKTREEAGLSCELPSDDTGFINAKSIINGKDAFITVNAVYIPQLDDYFYVSVAAPTDEINAVGIRLMASLTAFSIAVCIVIAALLYFVVGGIIEPIREIAKNADKIAGGEYGARITGNFRGEFGVVRDSVNAMADSIEAYVEESENSLDILKAILDGLDAFIYVTIPETGELLFINERMKKHFGIEGEGTGQHCYKILRDGAEEKCDFCPCALLDAAPDKPVVWEMHNSVTNRDYRNTDCYISWHGGMRAHLQHSVDITDLKRYMVDKHEAERAALELRHEKEKAEAAAKAKNDFLAKMSHEIRTPMNAVVGMTELILRKEPPQDIFECAVVIKSAGTTLLAIINDILDFSKIEAGMLEIVEEEYLLPSLINDVLNVIRIRLVDKPVQFVANIEPDVPAALIGDEIRIRQVIINLLSNAVKYTNEGRIALTVGGEINGGKAVLRFGVSDSGLGIKEEDLGRLFGDFSQVDKETNKGIEGTGLGLAISRNLCRAMGGDITVKSEYGSGSVFTVTLPQGIKTYEPFASVERPAEKGVLLYETRRHYRDSIVLTLESLGVRCESVESIPALFERLEEYPYVFVSSFMYGSVGPAVSKLKNPPKLAILTDITDVEAPRDARLIIMPAHSLSVANLLNDVRDNYCEADVVTGASFTAPEARVLIVDDIMANLKVCEGLLLPYEMRVVLCGNGREAVELVAENYFDLVFMDHMMPDMDGIEATRRIRAMEGEYFKTLPIIALTANAVSGVREMFVQNGMNDFLAKPIDVAKLDATLLRWIPKNKRRRFAAEARPEESSGYVEGLRVISRLNVGKALELMGGSVKTYERTVKLSASLLTDDIASLDRLVKTDLRGYSIAVHGMKGVLNNIGAYELGKTAQKLERLSKDGDGDSCLSIQPGFSEELYEFSRELRELAENAGRMEMPEGSRELLEESLQALCEAADYYDAQQALEILSALCEYTYGLERDGALAEITKAFEVMDYDAALDLTEKLRREIERDEKRGI